MYGTSHHVTVTVSCVLPFIDVWRIVETIVGRGWLGRGPRDRRWWCEPEDEAEGIQKGYRRVLMIIKQFAPMRAAP